MKASAWSSPARRPATQWAPCFANRKLPRSTISGFASGTATMGSCAGWEGFAALFRGMLAAGSWYPTLAPPTLVYCFANPRTGVSTFDSFRFMLRRAYARGDGSAALCDAAARRHAGTLASRSVSASATNSGCGSSSASTSRRQSAPDANRCRFGTSATPTPSPANRFLPRATLPRCGGSGSIRTTARPPAI